jgi:uncharacterized circularly permuted ATP-grasp superfamily protein
MYRNEKRTVEDCLVTELYLEVIRQAEEKSKNKNAYKRAKELLQEDLNNIIGLDTKIAKRLFKASKIAFDHFIDNKFDTRKCFLTLSLVAGALNDNDMAELPSGTIKVIADTNRIVQEAYNDPSLLQEDKLTQEELLKIYRSAEKHATKLIKKLQKDGYY